MKPRIIFALLQVFLPCSPAPIPVISELDAPQSILNSAQDQILLTTTTNDEVQAVLSKSLDLESARNGLLKSAIQTKREFLFENVSKYLLKEEGLVLESSVRIAGPLDSGTFQAFLETIRSLATPVLESLKNQLPPDVYELIKSQNRAELIDIYQTVTRGKYAKFRFCMEQRGDGEFLQKFTRSIAEQNDAAYWELFKEKMDIFIYRLTFKHFNKGIGLVYINWYVQATATNINDYMLGAMFSSFGQQMVLDQLAKDMADTYGKTYSKVTFDLKGESLLRYDDVSALLERFIDSPTKFSDPLIRDYPSFEFKLRSRLSFGSFGSKYKLETHCIGRGAFGQVFEASIGDKKVAVKQIRVNQGSFHSLYCEVRVLQEIQHPNIIRILDVYWDPGYIRMVLEYGGNSLSQLRRKRIEFTDIELARIANQILNGLETLHANNIIHRDIKPGNILMDDSGLVRIIDFGLVQKLNPANPFTKLQCGTDSYYAPEVARKEFHSFPIDIWGVGVILWELIELKTFIRGESKGEIISLIGNLKEIPFESDRWNNVNLKDFVKTCLSLDPSNRKTAKVLLGHPLLKSGSR